MASPMTFLGRVRALGGRVAAPDDGMAAEAHRQRALAVLAQRALEGAETRELMTLAATLVAETLAVRFGAVLQWDGDGMRLRLMAGVGWEVGCVGGAFIERPAAALAAFREAAPIVFAVRADAPGMDGVALLDEHGIVGGVSARIVPRDRDFGVIAAYADASRPFTPTEVEFMEAIARLLAIAAGREYGERALFEEMQLSTVLAHVGRELMACVDVSILLERTCQLSAQALRCDHSMTWLRRPGEAGLRAVAATELSRVQKETLEGLVLPADAFTALAEDLARREGLRLVVPSERHPTVSALLARSGTATAIVAPLHEGDTVVGLQVSGHRAPGAEPGPQDERLAHGIAQLASMALMNARVFEELERASALKSEFVSTMSHELRTPLNIVIGYTDMLRDAATVEEQAPLLTQIRKASHELLELIDGTLNLNRLAAGGDVARFAPVVLSDLWQELAADFGALTARSEVEVRWQSVDGLEVHTDRRKLKIVLKNLVGNALKFTPRGEVVAACERVGDYCRFTVRDTGIGIPADAIPHVFDMFRQVDSSETRSYGGAGLGLYIVKSLLTQLGGQVQVESVMGQGTIFTVVLPIEPHAAAADDVPATVETAEHAGVVPGEPPAAPASIAPNAECPVHVRRRMLFADDLPLNRLLVQRFVAREFPTVDVIEACDGEQALALYETVKPHVVVLDLHMPNLDGWQTARRIRQCEGGRDVPLLALSVDASPSAETNAVRAGFKEFIAKPISDYSALKARLEYWLSPRDARGRVVPSPPSTPGCEQCGRDGRGASAA
jgi:signal transduction histidine kinase/ActR/RegA family two-component response regulator